MSDINYLPNARNQGAGNAGASPWAVSGTVTIAGGVTVQPAAMQAVSGSVSVLNFPAIQSVSGTVTVSNSMTVTIPNPLGVSGTVSIGNSPNVGQTAGPWAVSGSVSITNTLTAQVASPLGISGSVTANIPQPLAVSGTVLNAALTDVWDSINHELRTKEQGSPNVGQTAGPWAVSGTIMAQGVAAQGSVNTGNPVKMGLVAVSFGVTPPTVASGQITDTIANRNQIPFVLGGHPNIQCVAVQITSGVTSGIIITGTAGQRIIVTQYSVKTANSLTSDFSIRMGFGVTTVPAYGSTQILDSSPGIAAGSGFAGGDGSAVVGVSATGDNLIWISPAGPVGGSVDVNVKYFTIM